MTLRHRLAAAGLAAALTLTPAAGLTVAFLDAPVAQAAPSARQSASTAATWLATQLTNGKYYTSPYTGQADVATTADILLSLVAGGNTASAEKVNGWLKQNVSKAASAGQVAKIAIAAEAMGEDPGNYGGKDLLGELAAAIDKGKGSLGDPFSDSLALIAFKSSNADVPDSLVTALLKQQNKDGEFFFGSGDSAWPDPDTTGLAMQALSGVEGKDVDAARSLAVAWATANETSQGYWTSYSPSNTTALIAPALKEQGKNVSASLSWLLGQQAKAGGKGLPASLNGTTPDVVATAPAGVMMLAGYSYNNLPSLPEPTPTPTSTSTPSATSTPSHSNPSHSATSAASSSTSAPAAPLPATGGPASGNGDLGIITLSVVSAGVVGGAVALRARRHA